MRIVLAFLFILSFVKSNSQDTLYISYDDHFQATSDSLATHRGILVKQEGVWQASVYNLQSKKLALIYYLSEKDFKLTGLYRLFSSNGSVIEKGYYHENLKVGSWKSWDNEGHLIDSVTYEQGQPKTGTNYNYVGDALRDYRFVDYTTNHKISKEWNESAVLIMEADFLNKKGHLKTYHSNGILACVTEFDETGKQTAVKYFNDDGGEIDKKRFDQIIATHKAESESKNPEFPGGSEGLENFIKNNFIKVVVAGSTQQYPRKLEIEFYLNKDGRVINFKSINAQDATINSSLTMLFNKMPSWTMKGFKSWGPLYHTITIN